MLVINGCTDISAEGSELLSNIEKLHKKRQPVYAKDLTNFTWDELVISHKENWLDNDINFEFISKGVRKNIKISSAKVYTYENYQRGSLDGVELTPKSVIYIYFTKNYDPNVFLILNQKKDK